MRYLLVGNTNVFFPLTKSDPRPIQSISCNVRLSPPGNPASWLTGDFWSNNVSLILANPYNFLRNYFYDFGIFWSLGTSLLCKVGEGL